jgi:hypothetical protein
MVVGTEKSSVDILFSSFRAALVFLTSTRDAIDLIIRAVTDLSNAFKNAPREKPRITVFYGKLSRIEGTCMALDPVVTCHVSVGEKAR